MAFARLNINTREMKGRSGYFTTENFSPPDSVKLLPTNRYAICRSGIYFLYLRDLPGCCAVCRSRSLAPILKLRGGGSYAICTLRRCSANYRLLYMVPARCYVCIIMYVDKYVGILCCMYIIYACVYNILYINYIAQSTNRAEVL